MERASSLTLTERVEKAQALARTLATEDSVTAAATAAARAFGEAARAGGAYVLLADDEGEDLLLFGHTGTLPPAIATGRLDARGSHLAAEAFRDPDAGWLERGREGAIALSVGGRAIGVVGFVFEEQLPGEDDVPYLAVLAAFSAQAISRARSLAEARALGARLVETERTTAAATERLTTVLEAGEAIARATDPQAVVARMTNAIVPRLADWCWIALRDEAGTLRPVAIFESDADDSRRAAEELVGTSVVHEVISTRRSTVLGDVASERFRGLGACSIIVAPLVARDETLGALVVVSNRRSLRYDATDLRLFEKLASRAALALHNAQLIAELRRVAETENRVAKRLRILAEASRSFAEAQLDARGIATALVSMVSAHLGDGAALHVLTEDGVALEPLAVRMADPARDRAFAPQVLGRSRPVLDDVQGEVLRTGRVVVLATPEEIRRRSHPDVAASLAEHPRASTLAVPLRAHGKVIGVLGVLRDDGPVHDEADVALLQDLADRAGIAVANARLHHAEMQARHTVERLQAVTSSLGKAVSPEDVARVVLHHAERELAGDCVTLHVLEAAKDELVLAHGRNVPPELASTAARVSVQYPGVLSQVLREDRPAFVESPEDYVTRFPLTAQRLAKLHPIGAFMAMPLDAGGERPLGVLAITFRTPRTFSKADRAFATNLAEQCAQALERAYLYAGERAAKREAEEANRLKDDFLATVSHELRTPLNAILGWASLLRGGRLQGEATDKAIATIERNARAQARLVDDVLDVSRIISGKLALRTAAVDPAVVLQQALEVVRPAALAKEIALDVDIESELPSVLGDPDRLQQVYWNLLSNAVKFTPRGGHVTVKAARRGGHVEVRVSDDGPGIAPHFLPHVFEPFRQADGSATRTHGGLGLGLSIARHLVQLHGGEITAKSDGQGHGATFIVAIPATTEETVNPLATGRMRRAARLLGLDVLVVDDDPDVRELAAVALQNEGAAVRTACSASEAMARIGERTPAVLVCDIGMPGEDGYSLLPRARAAATCGLPAIAFTAYADAEHAALVRKAGFDVHLAKPVDAETLVSAVARLAPSALAAATSSSVPTPG